MVLLFLEKIGIGLVICVLLLLAFGLACGIMLGIAAGIIWFFATLGERVWEPFEDWFNHKTRYLVVDWFRRNGKKLGYTILALLFLGAFWFLGDTYLMGHMRGLSG